MEPPLSPPSSSSSCPLSVLLDDEDVPVAVRQLPKLLLPTLLPFSVDELLMLSGRLWQEK